MWNITGQEFYFWSWMCPKKPGVQLFFGEHRAGRSVSLVVPCMQTLCRDCTLAAILMAFLSHCLMFCWQMRVRLVLAGKQAQRLERTAVLLSGNQNLESTVRARLPLTVRRDAWWSRNLSSGVGSDLCREKKCYKVRSAQTWFGQ